MKGFTTAEKIVTGNLWETLDEFNSPQPSRKVCVRIEINDRVGSSQFTRRMRSEFNGIFISLYGYNSADIFAVDSANFQRRRDDFRGSSSLRDLEGQCEHCRRGRSGHTAVECCQRSVLHGFGRLERYITDHWHHDYCAPFGPYQLFAGL